MTPESKVPDVVALVEDLAERGLVRGQVGTVVESLGRGGFPPGPSRSRLGVIGEEGGAPWTRWSSAS